MWRHCCFAGSIFVEDPSVGKSWYASPGTWVTVRWSTVDLEPNIYVRIRLIYRSGLGSLLLDAATINDGEEVGGVVHVTSLSVAPSRCMPQRYFFSLPDESFPDTREADSYIVISHTEDPRVEGRSNKFSVTKENSMFLCPFL